MSIHSGVPKLWPTGGDRLRPWTSIYLPSLEGLFPLAEGYGELVLGVPSTDKRPDRTQDPRARTLPPVILPRRSAQLEPLPPMGRVCTKLPPSEYHRTDPFPVHTRLSTPLFPWTGEPSEVPAVDYWFREGERVWDSAHVHLQRAVRRHKIFADVRRTATPRYQPGDLVWLSTRDLRLRLPSKKSPLYLSVPNMEADQRSLILLQLPPRYRIHPSFHFSLLKPCSSSSSSGSTTPDAPIPPEIPSQPPRPSRTLRSRLPSSPHGGVRSCPWKRG